MKFIGLRFRRSHIPWPNGPGCLWTIPDFKPSLWKEVPDSKIILWERLIQRFLFQRGFHVKFLLLKGLAVQYVSFDDGIITLLPGFYFMFVFPSPSSTTLEKVLITHICPRLSPLKEKQQQYHSPAAIGAGVRAFQEKHSDNTALECLSRKSSLGALACFLDSAIFLSDNSEPALLPLGEGERARLALERRGFKFSIILGWNDRKSWQDTILLS